MWACDWRKIKMRRPDIQAFAKEHIELPTPIGRFGEIYWQDDLLEYVANDTLFGIVECDIHVPVDLQPRFDKFPPIFVNREITRADIGPFMRRFAEENDLMKSPRRSRVSVHKAQRVLLTTPL